MSALRKVVSTFDVVMRRYTPDPFLFASGLTGLSLLLALVFTDHSLPALVSQWGVGFWSLLKFTTQMIMILIGGYLLATSPPVKRLLLIAVSPIKSPTSAVLMTTLIACAASWINWGFGLVIGALVAVEISKQVPKVSFRLLVASAYSGFVVWHGGLSGSIPLVLNTENNFAQKWVGRLVPLNETLFSSFNIVATIAVVLTLLVCNYILSRLIGEESQELDIIADSHSQNSSQNSSQISSELPTNESPASTPAEKLEANPWVGRLLGLLGLSYIVLRFFADSFKLDLNTINIVFLFSAIFLHGSVKSLLAHLQQASGKVGPILLQYPFYSGIMAILTSSGLAAMISQGFVNFSSPATFPWLTFLSAGLVNFFVPSGGGQWAVQAPVVLPAIQELGADMTKSLLAVAWGDAWTNLAQPFWALPLLSIAGLKIRDIMGLCLLQLFATGVTLSLLFLFF